MAARDVQQVLAALQNWPSNQQVAIDQLRVLADQGDDLARAVLAYMLGPQTGRWAEGIPYARAAIEAGASYLAYIYGQNLIGQGDAALRGEAPAFLRVALDEGWPVDPYSPVQQAVQQGDPATATQLLEIAFEPRPHAARQRWEQLITEVEARRQEVAETAAVVRSERERVVGEMQADREAVTEQRRSVEQLVAQVGALANKAAGGAIAEDYAVRAARVEETARRYTAASILLAVLIAVGATIATLVVDSGKLVDDAASKAAIAIPLVALNLYLVRLASQYRREAVELRHIELQFNTANPFLGLLDEERRKEVLVQLAPKFFPGQALPGAAAAGSGPDLNQVIAAALVDRLAPGGSSPKSPPDQPA